MLLPVYRFDLSAKNLIILKQIIKEPGQYDNLIIVNASIAMYQNYKISSWKQFNLLSKIGANSLTESLKIE